MHPARSVIFFTTASGAGYGLAIWLAVLAAMGLLPHDPVFCLVAAGLGLALIAGGLMSSTLHLGRPERAWRAMSQWRTSWLSREGLAAVVTFIPLGAFALAWTFGLAPPPVAALIGLAGAAMSVFVLYCTAMIYASLKAIPAWHNGWTRAGYLVLGPMNGAVILAALLVLFGYAEPAATMRLASIALLALGLLVKVLYWRRIHFAAPVSTAGSATGLGYLGKVELTASPHDSDNYLLREMGFRIARKHADKLRIIALGLGFVAPLLALAIATAIPPTALALTLAAWMSCQVGLAAERWLFFAEAKHVVTLFYGANAV